MIKTVDTSNFLNELTKLQLLDRTCQESIEEITKLCEKAVAYEDPGLYAVCSTSADAMNEVFKKYAFLNITPDQKLKDCQEKIDEVAYLQFNSWDPNIAPQFLDFFNEVGVVYKNAISKLGELQKKINNQDVTFNFNFKFNPPQVELTENEGVFLNPLYEMPNENEVINNQPLIEIQENKCEEDFEYNFEIVVICNVEEGHFLAVRGEDSFNSVDLAIDRNENFMTWDNGLRMTKEENNTWKIRLHVPPNLEFKILYDDQKWEKIGANHTIESNKNRLVIENISFQD